MSLQISIKQMLFSDKKGQGPKAQVSPSRVLVLGKRRQISAGGSGRARSLSLCPAALAEGARPPAPLALELQAAHSGVVQADLAGRDPGRLRCSYFREIGRCRGSLLPQAWAEARGGLGGGSGALQERPQAAPWAPAHPLSQGQETGWKGQDCF